MTNRLADIDLTLNNGTVTRLSDTDGKVRLIVNVASKCGLTPQYEALEALYRSKKDEGFEILAFPSNDFAGQEPGTDAEIADFCAIYYDVSFPLFAKTPVKGEAAHPLYQALTQAQPQAIGEGPMREKLKQYGMDTGASTDVLWNFEKFLVDKDGAVIGRFSPDVTPSDPRLVAAVDAALGRPTA